MSRSGLAWVVVGFACGGTAADEAEPMLEEPPACAVDPVAPVLGDATNYDADGSGSCSFDASPDRMIAAINAADYQRAAWCGSCVEVTGPKGEVVVRIVDKCPGCKPGGLDLSREAFAEIAPIAAGRIPISWRPVSCDVQGPLAYRFKAKSDAHWTAIQIRNHRYSIALLEARDDKAGAWRRIPRLDYNYFVATLGDGPYTFRVTDTRGNSIEDTAIPLGAAVTRLGASQFPICRGD